jgi:hypothetical protein
MNQQEMYDNIGPKPEVDIWDLEKVLSMKTEIENEHKETFCSFEDCGLNLKKFIGPVITLIGVLYLFISVAS